jgi:phosphatidylglycerophosphate synthase
MIDTMFRNFFGKVTLPFTKLLAKSKITPNAVTFMAVLVSSSAAVAIGNDRPIMALILWWSGRFLDSMDGELARFTGKATPFGAFLDITLDMLAYSSIILGLFFRFDQYQPYWILILFLYVGCITSALALGTLLDRANLENIDNRGLRLATGLAEGGETGIAYTLFLLFPQALHFLLPAWILILTITIVSRFLYAYKVSKVFQ